MAPEGVSLSPTVRTVAQVRGLQVPKGSRSGSAQKRTPTAAAAVQPYAEPKPESAQQMGLGPQHAQQQHNGGAAVDRSHDAAAAGNAVDESVDSFIQELERCCGRHFASLSAQLWSPLYSAMRCCAVTHSVAP